MKFHVPSCCNIWISKFFREPPLFRCLIEPLTLMIIVKHAMDTTMAALGPDVFLTCPYVSDGLGDCRHVWLLQKRFVTRKSRK